MSLEFKVPKMDRDDSSTTQEAHFQFDLGDSVPVLLKTMSEDILLGIRDRLNLVPNILYSPQELIDIITQKMHPLILLDIDYALEKEGHLISIIKERDPFAVILVILTDDRARDAVSIFDSGVSEFIILPISTEDFVRKAQSFLKLRRERVYERQLIDHSSMVLRKQLEWLNYKDVKRSLGSDTEGKSMIENLRISLSQGGGFGIILTLIDMIRSFPQIKDDHYVVDRETMELLFDNTQTARLFLEGLDSAITIMSREYVLETVNGNDIIRMMPEMAKGIVSMLSEKRLQLNYPVPRREFNAPVKINREIFTLAFEEILINAYKYSKADTVIEVYANISQGYFSISVKNQCDDDSFGKIPDDYTRLLIKPFFRMHPPVEDVVKVERFGLGLGLTTVNYIMNKLNGLLVMSTVRDHTKDKIIPCVLTQLFLPVSRE
jgi:signal transduction histidine kinase